MKTPFNTPLGFAERSAVKSRTIAKAGFANRGVIFSTSTQPSLSDFPNPDELIGLELENVKNAPADPDRFFKILGGYFYSVDTSGNHVVQGTFGICTDPSQGFDQKNGQAALIGESWTSTANTTKGLDETEPRPDGSPNPGWTFIVEPKSGEKVYPLSKDPLAIWVECGSITSLTIEEIELTDTHKKVVATAHVDGRMPADFSWNWGDGTTSETTTNSAEHTYQRPENADKTYSVSVTGTGSGECSTDGTSELLVPHIPPPPPVPCPELTGVKVEKTATTDTTVTVKAKAAFANDMPTSFTWQWGDGSNPDTTGRPEAEHTYERDLNVDKTYTIGLSAEGPDKCKTGTKTPVEIEKQEKPPEPPKCPEISKITAVFTDQDDETMTVKVIVETTGTETPTGYKYSWGDNSSETGTSPEATHVYAKPEKNAETRTITVEITGPGDCKSSGEATVTLQPKDKEVEKCPEITGIKIVAQNNIDGNKHEVKVEATYTGPKPDSFTWNWGEGTPTTTSTATTSYVYNRGDKDRACPVIVETKGPGNCKGSAKTTVTIPEKEEKPVSVWCRIMPYLVAFLAALMLGTLLVCIVAEVVEQTTDPGILIITAITIILFMVAVILWMMRGKLMGCPPSRCDWLAIGWVSMLAGLGTTVFVLECLESWIPQAIVFFVLAGFLAFLWFRDCAATSKAKTFIIYFLLSILAILIVCFGIAATVLTCV